MIIREMDRKAKSILVDWDPLQEGKNAYEQVAADVIEALHRLDHPADLAKEIRAIYANSFGLWIPIEKCTKVSYQLMAIKYKALSIL